MLTQNGRSSKRGYKKIEIETSKDVAGKIRLNRSNNNAEPANLFHDEAVRKM